MPCYHPVEGYAKPGGGFTTSPLIGYRDVPMKVSCGQCIGCRLERSRQWAVRCYHEAQVWDRNCFITLTYDNEHLPEDWSLKLRDFQLFMKKLRKRYGEGIRFFHCGEYGEVCKACRQSRSFCKCPKWDPMPGRPHYHAILFNHDFGDKKLWKVQNENPLFTSEELSQLWPQGYSSVGAATFQSAAYVARYILKKISGGASTEHYLWSDPRTGEIFERVPEYVTMSRRPGIGKPWLDKFKADVWPDDFVVVEGHRSRVPRFYDRCLEVQSPSDYRAVKRARHIKNLAHRDDQTPERLAVREKVQRARLERLPRKGVE